MGFTKRVLCTYGFAPVFGALMSVRTWLATSSVVSMYRVYGPKRGLVSVSIGIEAVFVSGRCGLTVEFAWRVCIGLRKPPVSANCFLHYCLFCVPKCLPTREPVRVEDTRLETQMVEDTPVSRRSDDKCTERQHNGAIWQQRLCLCCHVRPRRTFGVCPLSSGMGHEWVSCQWFELGGRAGSISECEVPGLLTSRLHGLQCEQRTRTALLLTI